MKCPGCGKEFAEEGLDLCPFCGEEIGTIRLPGKNHDEDLNKSSMSMDQSSDRSVGEWRVRL